MELIDFAIVIGYFIFIVLGRCCPNQPLGHNFPSPR